MLSHDVLPFRYTPLASRGLSKKRDVTAKAPAHILHCSQENRIAAGEDRRRNRLLSDSTDATLDTHRERSGEGSWYGARQAYLAGVEPRPP